MYRYRPYAAPGKALKQKAAAQRAIQTAIWSGAIGLSVMLAGLAATLVR